MDKTAISLPTAAARANSRLAGEGYMRLPDVLEVYPVSRSVWFQGIREGRYPQGVKIGKRARGWWAPEIRELLKRPA